MAAAGFPASTQIIKILLILAAISLVVWFLIAIKGILFPFALAFLIAYLFNPVVNRLEGLGIGRGWATLIIYLVLALLAVLIMIFVAPLLASEIKGLTGNILPALLAATESAHADSLETTRSAASDTVGAALSEYAHELIGKLQTQIESRLPRFMSDLIPGFKAESITDQISQYSEDIFKNVGELLAQLLGRSVSLVVNLFSLIFFLIIAPVVAFFVLKEAPTAKASFVELVPNRYFEMILNLIYRIDKQIGGYIRGQLTVSITIALLWTTALRIIGLKYYLVIGVAAGVLNLIPYLGPITTASIVIIVSLIQKGIGGFVPAALTFAVIQTLDGVFISPVVVARSVNLHPVVVLFVVLAGSQLLGIIGMILAVPITGIIKVTVQTLYEGFKSYSVS